METRINFMGVEEVRDEISVTETLKIDKNQYPAEREILDIHTHHTAPQPRAVISLRVGGEQTLPVIETGQAYSAGIHPWDTVNEIPEAEWNRLENLATLPQVVAVGEAGVDLNLSGGALFRQMQVFKRQILLSEKLLKPMVIHNVKGTDIIVGLKKDLKPKQHWAIHGFRGKPEVAYMLRRPGIYFSFGAVFNADTLRDMPDELILAETDESDMTIKEVIASISEVKGRDMTSTIAYNTRKFLEPQI